MKRKIVIFGAGQRVLNDVIPVIFSLKIKRLEIEVYSKRGKEVISRNIIIPTKKISTFEYSQNTSLFFLAVPVSEVQTILKKLNKPNNTSPIFIDTPISNKNLLFFENKLTLYVAEDVDNLIAFSKKKKTINIKEKTYPNILIMYKSFFQYHGVSFVESVLGKIILTFSLLKFNLIICKKGICICWGSKDYEEGYILLNGKNLELPKINSEFKNLIGGTFENDNFCNRFLELKRIGLYMQIKNAITGKPEISISRGFEDYKKSRSLFKKLSIRIF